MSLCLRATLCTLAFGVALTAHAATDVRAERARIRAAIAAADTAFVERERECRTRFVVTSCVEAARRERNEQVQALRREDSVLDEAQRRERAAQRQAVIRAKVEAAAERDRRADAAAPVASGPRTRVVARAPRVPVAAEAGASDAQRAAREAEAARRSAAQATRRVELEQEREAAERRAAARAKGKPPAAPLPVPAAASIPR